MASPVYKLRKGSLQWEFDQSRKKMQIFGGGYGNGKTTGLVIKALKIAQAYPGANMLLARSTYPKLNDTLRKEFLLWCPQEWIKRRPTQEDNTCYLTNGTIVNFRYIAQRGKSQPDGSSTSNLLSATYDFIGVDQVEDPDITEKDLLDLFGRLRGQAVYRPGDGVDDDSTMPSTGPRWIILTCNPTHNWFYQKIIQPYIMWRDRGVKTPDLFVSEDGQPIMDLFEGSTYTNAENLPEDFIRAQEAMYKGQMRDRYLLGKWAAFEGLVHPDFSMERNVIRKDQALEHLQNCLERHVKVEMLEGYDFGLVSPSCYLLSFVDDHGRVIIIDGFYRPEFNYTEQPDEIRRIRANYLGILTPTKPVQADPDIFKRKVIAGVRDTGDTIAKIYKSMGIRSAPASNEIIAGIAKVNGYIAGGVEIPHLITGETPGPLLYVTDDLDFIQDEIFSYYWKRSTSGKHIDVPTDDNDHAMNTIKYMLAKLPQPADIVTPKSALPPEWTKWHEVEMRS